MRAFGSVWSQGVGLDLPLFPFHSVCISLGCQKRRCCVQCAEYRRKSLQLCLAPERVRVIAITSSIRFRTVALLLVALAWSSCDDDTIAPQIDERDRSGLVEDVSGSDSSSDSAGTSNDEQGIDAEADTRWRADSEVPSGPLGDARPAKVFLPEAYTPTEAWPLAILLHGYSATGAVQDFYFGFSSLVDEMGFIGILPEGLVDPEGNQYWNATPACCNEYQSEVDDVAYLLALVEEAKQSYHVDPGRVYFLGHSNGGFMSHRLACEAAEIVTAVASLAGSTVDLASECQPSLPVGVLQVHGTLDDVIPYDGASGYPSADETVARWASYNGCLGEGEIGESLDYDAAVTGAETAPMGWTDCDRGVEVALWKMEGSSHVPGLRPDFCRDVMGFLLAHQRPIQL